MIDVSNGVKVVSIMNVHATFSTSNKPDIRGLVGAIAGNMDEDTLSRSLLPAQWDALAAYMHPSDLQQGQILVSQSAQDRTLYFVESGSLSVHSADKADRIHLAILGAGSVVGEGGFFSRLPRRATVQAASPCRVWSLTPLRFTELSNRQPAVALAVAMAVGAIVSRRMRDRRKRIAVT